MRPIRIVLADDQVIFRRGLHELLADEPELDVVGLAANGAEAVRLTVTLQPDVVVMDVRMPELDGVEATRQIRQQAPDAHVILFTTFDHDEYVFQGLKAGAIGYLLKDADPHDLVRAIQVAADGHSFLDPVVATKVVAAVARSPIPTPAADPVAANVSVRERELLHYIAQGYSNREIGAWLHLAEGSVKNQVAAIINKLHARDRTHAAILAKEHGLI